MRGGILHTYRTECASLAAIEGPYFCYRLCSFKNMTNLEILCFIKHEYISRAKSQFPGNKYIHWNSDANENKN